MEVTFDKLPWAVSLLFEKLERIESLLNFQVPTQKEVDVFFSVEEAAEFLRLAKPTLYALVAKRKIPCNKKGKRLYFSKKELSQWILQGKQKITTEEEVEMGHFLTGLKKRRKN